MNRKPHATIKDIAKALKISVSTVSRALRDTHDVSRSTREAVLQKSKELNFRINLNARGLKNHRTNTIGVIMPHIDTYYSSKAFTGIQQVAYENDFNVVLYATGDLEEREKKLLEILPVSSLDGLLICLTGKNSTEEIRRIMDYGLPVVFFDRVINTIHTSKVLQDDYSSAYMATQHLISRGYSKIGCISGAEYDHMTQERMRGFFDALTKHRLIVQDKWIIYSDFSLESGYNDMKTLWKQKDKPNGIFAINDRKGVGAISFLNERRIAVGKDVGVIGITNDPISTIIKPTLSTVEESAFDIGQKSCELLFKHIRKKNFIPEKIVLKCKLVERESTKR